jgi:hypothetical protein
MKALVTVSAASLLLLLACSGGRDSDPGGTGQGGTGPETGGGSGAATGGSTSGGGGASAAGGTGTTGGQGGQTGGSAGEGNADPCNGLDRPTCEQTVGCTPSVGKQVEPNGGNACLGASWEYLGCASLGDEAANGYLCKGADRWRAVPLYWPLAGYTQCDGPAVAPPPCP